MLLTTYKDYEINITPFGHFKADGIEESYNTLEALKLKIDEVSKIKYKKLDGILLDSTFIAMEVFITSPAKPTTWGNKTLPNYWVSFKNIKKRETRSDVMIDTKEVRYLLLQAQNEHKLVIEHTKKRDDLIKQAKQFEIVLEQM